METSIIENISKFYLILILGLSQFSCNRLTSERTIQNKVIKNIYGIAINNITMEFEDCNFPSVFFIVEIQNLTSRNIKLLSENKNELCEHTRLPSDATLHCSDGDTIKLKALLNHQTVKPDSVVKIKYFLQGFEIRGSILQIRDELQKKVGKKFYISTTKLVHNKILEFRFSGKLNEEFYLNSNRVQSNDLNNLKKGQLKVPVFEVRKRIDFLPPN